jgi:hypothetical protein
MMRQAKRSLPEEWVLPLSWSKNTPGERCIWDTMTRSVPFTMNVPVLRHQGHVPHVHFLVLEVLDGLGAGDLVHLVDDQAQRDLQRRGIGHVARLAFLDVVLGLLEVVAHELEPRGAVEVLDGEDRLEDALDALAVGGLSPSPERRNRS